MDKKYIIFGTGNVGNKALKFYGINNVAFFCDNFFPRVRFVEEIPVINWYSLKNLYKDYNIVVAAGDYKNRLDICAQLRDEGIPYIIYQSEIKNGIPKDILHIHGFVNALQFDVNAPDWNFRCDVTIKTFKTLFELYEDDFRNAVIDINVYVGDEMHVGALIADYFGIKYIFSFSTMDIFPHVIPIPDYRHYYGEPYPLHETPKVCKEAANREWEDSRIYWRGTATHYSRRWLKILAKKYPKILLVDMPNGGYFSEEETVYMDAYAKYKYQLDIQGKGWTDRVKILLQLGRPIFLVDRPYKEWYFDKLIPMKHYIPIKEDLSNLIEMYNYIENNPNLYFAIVNEMKSFVENNFTPQKLFEYLREVVLRFGVKRKDSL